MGRISNVRLLILSIGVSLALFGCASKFTYGGVSYGSSAEAIAAANRDVNLSVQMVQPVSSEVPGAATIIVPDTSRIRVFGVVKTGPVKAEQVNYIADVLLIAFRGMAQSLERGKAFEASSIVESPDPAAFIAPSEWSIWLDLQDPNTAQWYLRNNDTREHRSVPVDLGVAPRLRAAAWVNAVHKAAREMYRVSASNAAEPIAPRSDEPSASGTGFFVRPDGTIITSNHVVSNARRITARCRDRAPSEARIITSSAMSDIALLGTGLSTTNYLMLAPARTTGVGTRVFTYGFPATQILGPEPKFTDGAVSSASGPADESMFMQISVPVQPGNSGGPVVNERGEVVGIVAAGAAIAPFLKTTGTLPQNVNWAVKSEYAAPLFDPPPARPPSKTRDESIQRTAAALCFIETYE